MPPLTGIEVLDFSALLPGPLTSLILAEAGADAIKVERPRGDGVLAAAAIEEKFRQIFCKAIGPPTDQRDDRGNPRGVIQAVASRIRSTATEECRQRESGRDSCVAVMRSLEDAATDPALAGLFARSVVDESGRKLPALPLLIVPALRIVDDARGYAQLGAANALISRKGRQRDR